MTTVLIAVIATLIGGGAVFVYFNFFKESEVETKVVEKTKELTEDEIDKIVKEKASKLLRKAENEADELVSESEKKIARMRKELAEQEKLSSEREKTLYERSKTLDKKSDELDELKDSIKQKQQSIEQLRTRIKKELERVSGLTEEEAKKQLKKQIDEDIKHYKARRIRDAEKVAEEKAEDRAKNVVVESMQRIVTDDVGNTTTSKIKIDDEKVKGRIIGRDGRNIRAFEQKTGVDVIVDEAPDYIGLSSFDPLRREIARVAMEDLIEDGRIHPASIEDAIRKAKNEIAAEIKKNGQALADEADWPGLDIGLLKLVGKMKYRTSYGQSLMTHTIEVIRAGSVLAHEIGLDVDLVKKACLLHDVGKVLTHKVEGAHHHISGQIARKYGLPDKLVNAIEAHHLDIEPTSPEAVAVYLADALSGARPGARKDSYEQYIKRVEALENTAKDVAGDKINDVYAVHAGRELRVIVKPKETSDDDITLMSKEIADKIHKTQTYPGTVEVTVIRENRSTATAM